MHPEELRQHQTIICDLLHKRTGSVYYDGYYKYGLAKKVILNSDDRLSKYNQIELIEAKIIGYDKNTDSNTPTRPYRLYKKINARLQKVREGRYNGISEYDTIDINKIHK